MLALTFAYPVAAHDHRWQLSGKPRHQYQYDPFQQAGPDGCDGNAPAVPPIASLLSLSLTEADQRVGAYSIVRGDDQLIFFAHRSKPTEKLFPLKPLAKSLTWRRFVAPSNYELAHTDP